MVALLVEEAREVVWVELPWEVAVVVDCYKEGVGCPDFDRLAEACLGDDLP